MADNKKELVNNETIAEASIEQQNGEKTATESIKETPSNVSAQSSKDPQQGTPTEDTPQENIPEEDTPQKDEPKDETELFNDEFSLDTLKERYKEDNYLLFGANDSPAFLDTKSTLAYMEGCGFGNNGLKQARTLTEKAAMIHSQISLNEEGAHYCDFCAARLGAEYDVLNDGRERCYQCSRTVVKTVEELEKIFIEVIKNMEALFGISYYVAMDVKTMNAKKLARKIGIRYVSSPEYDGRVLGFAQEDKGTYHVCLENQSPYLCAVATMAHELTHIWQYLYWNESIFKRRYYPILKNKFPKISPRKIVYEGMAKWVEIQYLFLINEKDRAYLETVATLQREDEYGIGLAIYMNEYDFDEDTFISGTTPFDDKTYPLHNIG